MRGIPSLSDDTVSVVVKGQFNPAIFSPAWLLHQGIIGNPDFEKSNLRMISPQIAVFETAWLQVHVTDESLQLLTNDDQEFERVRDATVGILRTLEHTPISAMGLNRHVRFVVDSLDEWHRIGDRILPKDIWEGVLDLPGMQEATILGVRPDTDTYAGRIQVQVQPALGIQRGVQVTYNDHYDLTFLSERPTDRDSAQFDLAGINVETSAKKIPTAITILTDNWNDFMQRTASVIQSVYELSEE